MKQFFHRTHCWRPGNHLSRASSLTCTHRQVRPAARPAKAPEMPGRFVSERTRRSCNLWKKLPAGETGVIAQSERNAGCPEQVAMVITGELRASDRLARRGGEEFLLLTRSSSSRITETKQRPANPGRFKPSRKRSPRVTQKFPDKDSLLPFSCTRLPAIIWPDPAEPPRMSLHPFQRNDTALFRERRFSVTPSKTAHRE